MSENAIRTGPSGSPVRHVVMLGLMGSGKTTVGNLVARRLDWPVSDSDDVIQHATGKTVRILRDEIGVEAMHGLETAHLLRALSVPGPTVICAAASVVEDERCRQALTSAGVMAVWLRLSVETLASRFRRGRHRPEFGDDPSAFLNDQLVARSAEFAAVSLVAIDVDGRTPAEVADLVLSYMRGDAEV